MHTRRRVELAGLGWKHLPLCLNFWREVFAQKTLGVVVDLLS